MGAQKLDASHADEAARSRGRDPATPGRAQAGSATASMSLKVISTNSTGAWIASSSTRCQPNGAKSRTAACAKLKGTRAPRQSDMDEKRSRFSNSHGCPKAVQEQQQLARKETPTFNFVLSNCSWHRLGEVVATFRQPFDLLMHEPLLCAHCARAQTQIRPNQRFGCPSWIHIELCALLRSLHFAGFWRRSGHGPELGSLMPWKWMLRIWPMMRTGGGQVLLLRNLGNCVTA